MVTIAITIDEEMLEQLKKMEQREDRNRSEVIREAVRMYILHQERLIEEERERKIFRRNRDKLKKQVEAMITEQAEA
jgi:metal-responsive CopG/Arc/MetJ family transcriptional regulator